MSEEVVPAEQASVPATMDPDLMVGMEDLDESDIVMPTIKIDHKEAKFKDELTGQLTDSLDVVTLGLVKQRIMWHPDPSDDPPLCQSLNFKDGRPGEKFPYEGTPHDEDAEVVDCSVCPYKEWGSHPKRDVPYCSEQYTFVLGLPNAEGNKFQPAIISFRSSAVKAVQAYLSGFTREESPSFICRTIMGLTPVTKGSVEYAVPNFKRGDPIEEEHFRAMANTFRNVRSFLHTPRTAQQDEPMGAAVPSPEQPVPAPAEATAGGDPAADPDEMPF